MSRRIARPYAAALLEVLQAQPVDELRHVEEGLAAAAQVVRGSEELLRAFEVPSVPPATKRELVLSLGKAVGLRAEGQRLLIALAQHVRMRCLGEVVDVFRELIDRREGLLRGRVEVASPLSAEQLAGLTEALQAALGSRVTITAQIHPDLLAGFVVRIGSRVMDGSLRTRLRRFAASVSSL
jgi:F-type H+-transporting ATPase subunit delta